PNVRKVHGVVGVGGNDHLDAALLAHAEVDAAQVEALGVGVALHGHIVLGAGVEDHFHVEVKGFTSKKAAPGGVASDLGVGVFDTTEHAVGPGRAASVHRRV